MNLPFKMRTDSMMEQYRADSFFMKEPETLVWIRSFRPDAVFFDVGANVGVYSLFAASLFPSMEIYAFEPLPANYLRLKENIALNGFENIRAIPYAIGNGYGLRAFNAISKEVGSSGGQVLNWFGKKSEKVMLASLDGLCLFNHGSQLPYGRLPNPDYVKIDIDGQELGVVRGMINILPGVKSALIEVSGASRAEVVKILHDARFTTDNRFNRVYPHSSDRRKREGIDAENIVFERTSNAL